MLTYKKSTHIKHKIMWDCVHYKMYVNSKYNSKYMYLLNEIKL